MAVPINTLSYLQLHVLLKNFKFFDMAKIGIFALVISFLAVHSNGQSSTTTSSTDNMKYIESALANISGQIAVLGIPGVDHSLTSVTSLLQLTMLRELLGTRKEQEKDMTTSEQEVIELLTRIDDQTNATLTNQDILKKQGEDNEQAITTLQEEVSAMFSTLNSIKKDIKTVLKFARAMANTSDDSYTTSPLPTSCSSIRSSSPDSPSGYYTIIDNDGHTRHVYCDLSELCGSSEGWTRVAHLDMTDPQEKCPDGFKLDEVNGIRVCGRQSSGCQSTTFPSDGISYSEVCGKVIGYQFGSPDGAYSSVSINGAYLDGVSLTHGNPRSHIWSFISGTHENNRGSDCPCGTRDSTSAPSFVGKHYYCESGANYPWQHKLYTDDPLWDGKGCGSIEVPCCSPSSLPWFYRSFTYSTDDYIEMRICGNEVIANEDVPVSQYEIYIK